MAYRLFDHTADVGIEADGTEQGEALAQAGLALTELMSGQAAHGFRPDGELRFEVDAPDEASLAVAFLSELLWILESRDELWLGGGVAVEPTADGFKAKAAGNRIRHEPAKHGRGVEVKAVTYHQVMSQRDGARWKVRVLLDI